MMGVLSFQPTHVVIDTASTALHFSGVGWPIFLRGLGRVLSLPQGMKVGKSIRIA